MHFGNFSTQHVIHGIAPKQKKWPQRALAVSMLNVSTSLLVASRQTDADSLPDSRACLSPGTTQSKIRDGTDSDGSVVKRFF